METLHLGHHLLFLFLALVMPLRSYQSAGMWRAMGDLPGFRAKAYKMSMAGQWVAALLAVALIGPTQFYLLPPGIPSTGNSFVAWSILVGASLGMAMQAVLMQRSARYRSSIARDLEGIRFLLPRTGEERLLWVGVSVTAGICEEILFRSFVLRYLLALPFGLPFWAALVLSSILFGLQHFYQGTKGAFVTAALGAGLGWLFLATGNLIVPALLHALVDLRVLLLLSAPRPESGQFKVPTHD